MVAIADGAMSLGSGLSKISLGPSGISVGGTTLSPSGLSFGGSNPISMANGFINIGDSNNIIEIGNGDIKIGGSSVVGADSNNAAYLNGQTGAYYTNANNLSEGIVPHARQPTSLSAFYNVTPDTNKLIYYANSSSVALSNISAFALTLLDDANAEMMRTTLNVPPDLGYTPANKAGDTFSGQVNLYSSGAQLRLGSGNTSYWGINRDNSGNGSLVFSTDVGSGESTFMVLTISGELFLANSAVLVRNNFANTSDAATGTNNDVIMSPATTKHAIDTHALTVSDISDEVTAKAGTNNDVIMTPLRTAQAISALATELSAWEVNTTATGSTQVITLPEVSDIDDLLIFVEGIEQNGEGITQTAPAELTFDARTVGHSIRIVRMGGPAGKSFKPDAVGALADRSLYNAEQAGFTYLVTDDVAGPIWFNDGAGGWDGPVYVRGATGDPGANALNPWEFKNSSFSAVDKGRYIMTGGITATLPAPSNGLEVWFMGNFYSNNATIDRNGATIAGSNTNLVLNADNISPKLTCWANNWYVAQ